MHVDLSDIGYCRWLEGRTALTASWVPKAELPENCAYDDDSSWRQSGADTTPPRTKINAPATLIENQETIKPSHSAMKRCHRVTCRSPNVSDSSNEHDPNAKTNLHSDVSKYPFKVCSV